MPWRSVAASLLATLVLIPVASRDAASLERAGSSAAVRGQVARANDEQPVGLQVVSGEPIFLADRITSGPNSGMQIMLLDQTTFTIGPDSFVKIDEFVYDPASGVGKVTATLGKGVFRFVTGKIAQANPSSMTVKLPNATIGIRGTMVYGRTDGDHSLIALAGAGPDNNTHDRPAGIDVITPDGTAKIRRPGWGAIVDRGRAPVVEQLPKPTIEAILSDVAPRELVDLSAISRATGAQPPPASADAGAGSAGKKGSAGQAASGASADDASGQSPASALPTIDTFFKIGGDQPTNPNAVGAAQLPPTVTNNPIIPVTIFDGLSSFADLRTLNSGVGTFIDNRATPILLNGNGASFGTYTFNMVINFGAQTIFETFSPSTSGVATANTPISFAYSYAALNGVISSVTRNFTGFIGCGPNALCDGVVDLSNSGGVAAKIAFHQLRVTNTLNNATGFGGNTVVRP